MTKDSPLLVLASIDVVTRVPLVKSLWEGLGMISDSSLESNLSASIPDPDPSTVCRSVLISPAVWSAVAPVSIPFSFVWSASVNTLEFEADSTNDLISAAVWSAVAPVSIPFSLVWSALVKTLESVADSTNALISDAVWSAVAPDSIPFNLVWSAFVKFWSVWDATVKSISLLVSS